MKDFQERFRARWADVILNFAESLPTFNAGVIADLQLTRKRQREWSDRDFERSRLPEGSKIRLFRFTLARLYPLEDLELMEASLRRWFPKTWDDRSHEASGDAEGLTGMSWSYIGHIIRKRGGLFPGEVAILDDLPPEIEHISIEAQKVLPSLRALAFGIFLSEDVSARLLNLYNARYLGSITFHHWVPFARRRWGRSEGSPEAARERAIYAFVEDLRVKAEKFVARHSFVPSRAGVGPLVALDEFHVSRGKLSSQQAAPGAWGEQFGFRAWSYNSFGDGFATFLAKEESSGLCYPHRLVVSEDPELGDITNSRIANTIHELIPFLSLLRILEESENSVGRLRLQVFRRMANSGFVSWLWRRTAMSFSREVRLNSALQIHRMLLARLGVEYRQHKDLLGSWCSGLKPFVRVHKADVNLLDSFQMAITRRIDIVSEHLGLASESFSAHVSARNLDRTYSLGRKVFYLTVIVTIATILGILGDWPAILCGLKDLRHLLFR